MGIDDLIENWPHIRGLYLRTAADIDLRFRSGNSVPVTRAHITNDEWKVFDQYEDASEALSIQQALTITRLTSELDRLRKDAEARQDVAIDDGVSELPAMWRKLAKRAAAEDLAEDAYNYCADELQDALSYAAMAPAWDACRNSGTNWNLHTAEDFIEAVCSRAREIDAAIAAQEGME